MSIEIPVDLPKLSTVSCGLNPKIEEMKGAVDEAKNKISNLMSGSGGISSSISSLKSTLSSAVSSVESSLNKNLLGDIPQVGVKLQDEFKGALASFSGGNAITGLSSLSAIAKQFPTFDIQSALNKAAGILPVGAIPSNAAELIKGDLKIASDNLTLAIPQFNKLGGDLTSSISQGLTIATENITSGISALNSGAGITTADLTTMTADIKTAVSAAPAALSKLGGVFSSAESSFNLAIDKGLSAISNVTDKLLPSALAKIPAFDCCKDIPNQQVENGVVVEKATPPVKPTENAVKAAPPTEAPKTEAPSMLDPNLPGIWDDSTRIKLNSLFKSVTDSNFRDNLKEINAILEEAKGPIYDNLKNTTDKLVTLTGSMSAAEKTARSNNDIAVAKVKSHQGVNKMWIFAAKTIPADGAESYLKKQYPNG